MKYSIAALIYRRCQDFNCYSNKLIPYLTAKKRWDKEAVTATSLNLLHFTKDINSMGIWSPWQNIDTTIKYPQLNKRPKIHCKELHIIKWATAIIRITGFFLFQFYFIPPLDNLDFDVILFHAIVACHLSFLSWSLLCLLLPPFKSTCCFSMAPATIQFCYLYSLNHFLIKLVIDKASIDPLDTLFIYFLAKGLFKTSQIYLLFSLVALNCA